MLTDAGYDILFAKDVTGSGAADPLVCAAAEITQSILISFDNDMRRAAQRQGVGGRRFPMLSLIKFFCAEPKAAARLAGALSLVEHEWSRRMANSGRRIYIEIGTSVIRVNR